MPKTRAWKTPTVTKHRSKQAAQVAALPTRKRKATESREEAIWNERFGQLRTFRQRNGHCRVPKFINGTETLSAWACRQRKLFREGKLDQARKDRLDSLGYTWDKQKRLDEQGETFWNECFEQLRTLYQRNGNCQVTKTMGRSRSLSDWVCRQRKLFKEGQLSQDKIGRLDSLGFFGFSLDKTTRIYSDQQSEPSKTWQEDNRSRDGH
jgi:hypothetical protein